MYRYALSRADLAALDMSTTAAALVDVAAVI
jgi:hypothetical protein